MEVSTPVAATSDSSSAPSGSLPTRLSHAARWPSSAMNMATFDSAPPGRRTKDESASRWPPGVGVTMTMVSPRQRTSRGAPPEPSGASTFIKNRSPPEAARPGHSFRSGAYCTYCHTKDRSPKPARSEHRSSADRGSSPAVSGRSAQGDLPRDEPGAGAALVRGQRLGDREGLLQPRLELRRGARPVLGRRVGREIPHRDDEAQCTEGAGVASALAEQDLLRCRQPGERVEELL